MSPLGDEQYLEKEAHCYIQLPPIFLGYHVFFILLIVNTFYVQGVFTWDTGILRFDFCPERAVELEPPTYL